MREKGAQIFIVATGGKYNYHHALKIYHHLANKLNISINSEASQKIIIANIGSPISHH
jgi:S-adenosylmethionine synthetase